MGGHEQQPEPENLFTQYSRIRGEMADKLRAEGKTARQISKALWDIVPFVANPDNTSTGHKGTDEGVDTRWDVPDAFGEMPGAGVTDEVQARLAELRHQFHADTGTAELPTSGTGKVAPGESKD